MPTVVELIASYRTDPASAYHAKRFRSREHTDCLCRIIETELGTREVADLKTRDFILAHQSWTLRGVHMAHALIGQFRTLMGYGSTMLEDDACARAAMKLHGLRFAQGKPRQQFLTATQVVLIRRTAHAMGLHSLALAQAFQFECMFRQRDTIGEWMPLAEPCRNYLVVGQMKWWRGIRWEEIDAGLVLRHVTSKRQKEITVDLKRAGMVMEELTGRYGVLSDLPQRGPIIVSEATELPYQAHAFRRQWRMVARKAGVPDHIWNMDTRSGAITEALQSGASLDAVRKAATHSDAAMTQRYSRNETEDRSTVQRLRAERRAG
jgi:integrase-like protein